jgi:hypothetical protein
MRNTSPKRQRGMDSAIGRSMAAPVRAHPSLALRASVTMAVLMLACGVQAAERAVPTLLEIERDPALMLVHRQFQKWAQRHHDADADAPAGVNRLWQQGQSPEWFIEEQRSGAELIEAGIVLHDAALVRSGWKILDWGFARQSSDGGFEGSGDPFHSTSLFVEAAARSLLLLRQSGDAAWRPTIDEHVPRLLAAARWLEGAKTAIRGRRRNMPYTHRRYLLAAALGETATLTGDAALARAAAAYACEGLALQRADGVNPEKDGFDVNYQGFGVLVAARYLTVCDDAQLREKLVAMIGRAMAAELPHLDADGKLSTAGSTRVAVETGRSGNLKTVNYKEAYRAFLLAARLTGQERFAAAARRIAVGQKWLPQ